MRRKPLARTPKAPKAPRPERVQFSCTMNAHLLASVDRVAREHGRSRSEQLDLMAKYYIDNSADAKFAQ